MIRAVVDRLEGGKAVLLVGEAERSVIFPRQFLPSAITEGCYLKLDIEIDWEYTQAAEREAKELLAELNQQNE